MAHSSSITNMKEEAVRQLLNCDMFVDALDAKDFTDRDELIGTHIFTYPINPDYLTEPCTFVIITTHIPKIRGDNKCFVHPKLIFQIVSHVKHMKLSTKQFKTGANRNDFISQIIDHLFNSDKSSEKKFGFFGQLDLITNEEGYINKDWTFRTMVFDTVDLDKALCDCKTKEFFAKHGYPVPDGLL